MGRIHMGLPKTLSTTVATFDRLIIWATGIVLILLMASMVGSVIVGVFYRYVLAAALPWPEEFARFAMIWVTMLGASLVLRYQGHIAVTLLVEALPRIPQSLVVWTGRVLVAVFLLLLAIKGIEFLDIAARQRAPAMGISMTVPYFALPVGALLMLYHLVVTSVAPTAMPPLVPLSARDGDEGR